MNEEAKEKLDLITKKEVVSLTDYEKRFLKARSTYLTSAQKEYFKAVLTSQPLTSVANASSAEGELVLTELKERGAKVGLKYRVGTKKEDFLKEIIQAEAK